MFVHLKPLDRQKVIMITAGSFCDVRIALPRESDQKGDTIKEQA